MSIHELLANFDGKDLRVQLMHECMEGADATKKGCRVKFRTDVLTPYHLATDSGPVGILVWIPRDKWEAFQKQQKPGAAS